MIVTSLSQLFPTDFISSLQSEKTSENTSLHNEILLQIWKQQENSAMLLAGNKQQKEITKNRKTQQDRQNTQKRTAGKNKDQRKKEQEKGFAVPQILERYLVGCAVQHHHTEPTFRGVSRRHEKGAVSCRSSFQGAPSTLKVVGNGNEPEGTRL
jgi:hypothetical protein